MEMGPFDEFFKINLKPAIEIASTFLLQNILGCRNIAYKWEKSTFKLHCVFKWHV